jgi:hypothetical protein
MNRRVWTGILAGVLAATVLLGVAGAAYRAGEHHEVVTRTVGDGEVVRVVGGYGYGGGWGYGHGGFFLFPLLTILLVFLAFRAFRGPWRGGSARYGYSWGGGCGGGPGGRFEERHREAHERAGAGPPDAAEI